MWHSFHVILIRVWAAVITHNHCRKFEKGSLRTLSVGGNRYIWWSPQLCDMIRAESTTPVWQSRQLWLKKFNNLPKWSPSWSVKRLVPVLGCSFTRLAPLHHQPQASCTGKWAGLSFGQWSMTQYPGTFPCQPADMLLGPQAACVLKWMRVKWGFPNHYLFFQADHPMPHNTPHIPPHLVFTQIPSN